MRKTTIALTVSALAHQHFINNREMSNSYSELYKRRNGTVLNHPHRAKKQRLRQMYGRK
ncbi:MULTISPECIES: hypothetical protein [Pasteurellaceae]|uniref:Uncharacterized protein n=1 Tax=Pasteurella atlantica TaxID=2827233 RepID=A0AAW8CPC9_9PAST|nr:hypothetical protein [Pasteurella atlantica]MBR0574164.1 hypothetical protein [Pasteurella atlantica]MDP8039273.1 hypothetical protein [Pasteurella atlantica]MDP8041365.1 hypothetical protein [Pasteurella atlantica]MDP8043501.1 hypothetical protein [Pasteurella atlantica]MDP8045581.1 hypothetical protein [Pasteurella atlantica]